MRKLMLQAAEYYIRAASVGSSFSTYDTGFDFEHESLLEEMAFELQNYFARCQKHLRGASVIYYKVRTSMISLIFLFEINSEFKALLFLRLSVSRIFMTLGMRSKERLLLKHLYTFIDVSLFISNSQQLLNSWEGTTCNRPSLGPLRIISREIDNGDVGCCTFSFCRRCYCPRNS